jgi:hypothetical protein
LIFSSRLPAFMFIQRGEIGPLQVVQEHDEGVPGGRDGADEALQDQVEAVLRLGGPHLRHARLRAEELLHLRDDVDDHLRIDAERAAELSLPGGALLLALRADLRDELAECAYPGRSPVARRSSLGASRRCSSSPYFSRAPRRA